MCAPRSPYVLSRVAASAADSLVCFRIYSYNTFPSASADALPPEALDADDVDDDDEETEESAAPRQ